VSDGAKPVGNIQQLQKYGSPLYSVRTPVGTEILQITGPDMGRCCFNIRPFIGSLEFEIIDPKDETMIGRIVKQWGGFAREFFTKADIWGIKFPPDMDTSTKALLLASVFLIVSKIEITFEFLNNGGLKFGFYIFLGLPVFRKIMNQLEHCL